MTLPVPLKHHTETAFIVFLGVMICLFGFLTSLLPSLDNGGLRPWSVVFVCAVFYPLVLRRTLRINRADYEFRALHWFPALIVFLWLLLELGVPYAPPLSYLKLGFFFLWSLPLVILGIALLVIFSLHVIRRRVPRVVSLTLTLFLFFGIALTAESAGLHDVLQQNLFVHPAVVGQKAMHVTQSFGRYLASFFVQPDDSQLVVAVKSSVSASVSSSVDALQAQGELKPVIDRTNLDHLSKTGPESFAFGLIALLALYSVVLHRRARVRMDV